MERHCQKWAHAPSRVGAWEMPSERNDARGGLSLPKDRSGPSDPDGVVVDRS